MPSNNWRISLKLDDRTSKVLTDTSSGVGYTTIKSPRGTLEPTRFAPGESDRMIQNFGTPNASNKELLEAIYYNESYPIYVSAPSFHGRIGAIAVGKAGVEAFADGSYSESFDDASAISQGKNFTEIGDGVEVDFTLTYGSTFAYNAESLVLYRDGVAMDPLIFTTVATGETFTIDAGADQLSGEINTDTKTITITMATAPALGEVITAGWTSTIADVEFFIRNAAPQVDDLAVTVEYQSGVLFDIDVLRKATDGTYETIINGPKTVSLDPESVDGFGISNYIVNSLESDYFDVVVLDTALTADWSSFTDTVANVDMGGGYRGFDVEGANLIAGYDYAQQSKKYAADVFFDATADSAVPAVFNSLRNNYQHFARYILPLPMLDVDDAISAFEALSIANRGISVYWNWGIIRNLYSTAGNVASCLTGEIAKKHADTIVNGFGGIAPAWIDENGMGGEMNSGRIVEMIYDADEDQLQTLDESRINPVVQDTVYGVLIKSRRTTQLALTDYSFIDYSGAADYILKNIINQVLPYQLIKFNDTPHRDRVRSKAEAIISPMTLTPTNVIENFAVKCDSENNNDIVRDNEQFVLSVAVQFTRKSRTIIFNFINTPTSSSVDEAFV